MDEQTAEDIVSVGQQFNTLLEGRPYHNQFHAQNVVVQAVRLGNTEQVSEEEEYLARIASWFHDIGYVNGQEGHEEIGADIAESVMRNNGASDTDIQRVREAILSTRVPEGEAIDIVSQLVSDADLRNLGKRYPKFIRDRASVYEEFDPDAGWREWNENQGIPLLEYMIDKGYETETASDWWGENLEENLSRLRNEVKNGVPTVLVGGTFDVFHAGHMELLETAFGYGNPIIGITSDELANKTRDRDVEPFKKRHSSVQLHAGELAEQFNRSYETKILNHERDVATLVDADIIIVSEEDKTQDRAEKINEIRQENGNEALEVIEAPELLAHDGERISATRIRSGEITHDGKPAE